MRVQRGKLVASALGAVLLVSATGCSATTATQAAPDADTTATAELPEVQPSQEAIKLLPADLQEGGTITMAADLHYPPTSFLADDNKTPVGYNVDVAQLLGETLGLEVKVENVTWDGVIPGIAAHRYDFTATNMTPTPDRLKVLDMITYWNAGSSLIAAKGNPEGLNLADESMCGKKIAVMTGSTQQEKYLPEISEECEAGGEAPVSTVVLPNAQGALTQLASKRIDGVFADTSQLAWAAKQQPQAFELLSPQYQKKEGDDIVALGLPKDSPLTPALHAAMQELIDNGAYQAALDRWGLGSGAIPTSKVVS
ncbi:ABC transporter substrate-binding protein [Promicromonospora panici]|uniref:ABC transporter substrate-binding protein n=1 Tax=Promicromonospora panici TaxID=2219658 RepID=UPI00101BDA47|nr:ABC transporter substrate-binding protein [Promicromonospora panici]